MARRFQYPVLQEPVLDESQRPETINVDQYHTQTNEPVKLVPFIFAAVFAAGLSGQPLANIDSGTSDGLELGWFSPYSEPVRLDPGDRPDLYSPTFSGQRLEAVDTGISDGSSLDWFIRLSEPIRRDPLARPDLYSPAYQPDYRDDPETGQGPEQIEWFYPYSEPVRLDPLDRPDLYSPEFFVGNLVSIDTGSGPEQLEWFIDINQPRIQRKALLVSGLTQVSYIEATALDKWYTDPNERVVKDPLDRPDLYTFADIDDPKPFQAPTSDTGPGPEELEWFVETNQPYLTLEMRADLHCPAEVMGREVVQSETGDSVGEIGWMSVASELRHQRKALLVFGEDKLAPAPIAIPEAFQGWFVETNLPPAAYIEMGSLFAGHVPNYVVESKTGPSPEEIEWLAPLSEPAAYLVPPGRPDLYSPTFSGQKLDSVDTGTGPEQLEWLPETNQPYPAAFDLRYSYESQPFVRKELVTFDKWFMPFSEPIRLDPLGRPDLYGPYLFGQTKLITDSEVGPGPEGIEWKAQDIDIVRRDPFDRPDLYSPHFFSPIRPISDSGTGPDPEELEWIMQPVEIIRLDPLGRSDLYSPAFFINEDPLPLPPAESYKPVIIPRRRP